MLSRLRQWFEVRRTTRLWKRLEELNPEKTHQPLEILREITEAAEAHDDARIARAMRLIKALEP